MTPTKRRLLVGLTGGLAAGKSTVGRMLAEHGCTVVDADRIVRELYEPAGAGTRAVVDLLGEEALTADGRVDRAWVAERVFSDERRRRLLEEAVHPLVKARFDEIAATTQGIVVLEAPVLVEAGWTDEFALVVTVEAPRKAQVERAVARGMDREEAERRIDSQSSELRRREADVVLDNDGDAATLRHRIDGLVAVLRESLDRVT